MDLEGFDDALEANLPADSAGDLSFARALDNVDRTWYIRATRSARWMDLLGDYAGTEPFLLDGEAMLQLVLDDPLLLIGRDASLSFQILHAYHILENMVLEYHHRSANFEIAFWDENKHLSIQTGHSTFAVASRALARSMLFAHLLKLPVVVHVFDSLEDPAWKEYKVTKKPMFIMTNDGGVESTAGAYAVQTAILLCQRIFLLKIHAHGIPLALLKGAEYRDSKISSFVYEPMAGTIALLSSQKLRKAVALANHTLHKHLFDILGGGDIHFRLSNRSEERANNLFDILLFDIVPLVVFGVPPEAVYLFLVHCLLLPALTVRERAQIPQSPCQALVGVLRDQFLSPFFSRAAGLLAERDCNLDVDGTIFSILLNFVIYRGEEISAIVGPDLQEQAQTLWRAFNGPALDFGSFSRRYVLPESVEIRTPISPRGAIEPHHLLPFRNPVFDQEFSFVCVPTEDDDLSHHGNEIMFSDTRHWHNQKSILPFHLGGSKPITTSIRERKKHLRLAQRFMTKLQAQAATLVGASGGSLRQIIIPAVGSPSKEHRRSRSYSKSQKPVSPVSSGQRLRLKIKEERDIGIKEAFQAKWKQQRAKLKDIPSPPEKIASMKAFSRNCKVDVPELSLELDLFFLHLEMETWILESERDGTATKDRFTVSIIRMVQNITRTRTITPAARKILATVLTALGFHDYIPGLLPTSKDVKDHRLSFHFIKLIDSNSTILYPFMKITEHPVIWQLRLFGDYMDRSMDSLPDPRVAFEADAWQRRVLDGIDQNKSLLVIAPTSAGKTFISFYAMEKVLRESDHGVLVYIAPTKALVSQIAAEVYARFSKTLKGGSCWAILTRDFRIHDPHNCQILVTVPEMLAIMLFSPALARVWTPRIKRIILDEIHSIGQQEGGPVWEQILLLAPCPIIGLSATIGSPHQFSDWLAAVQKAHNFEYEFIEHAHRYSHLRKYFYLVDGKGDFTSLEQHVATNRTRFLHPISILSFGTRSLPDDLSLEASDTLSLYNALLSVQHGIDHDLSSLAPSVFFAGTSTLLRQRDVFQYEARLKAIVIDLMQLFDPRDPTTPLGQVIRVLQDGNIRDLGDQVDNVMPSPTAFKNDLLVLLADLHATGDLPAILFNFDRTNCELMARHILESLEQKEEEWRSRSVEWTRKMKQWDVWKSQAKVRERVSERQQKQKRRLDNEDSRDSSDLSWESSFDPNHPSLQFSFVGHGTSYSISDLEADTPTKELSWSNVPPWAMKALRRGIAVHHAGMNKHYRTLVESLFRRGFVRVIIATGTLALGINAPTKTSIFCGDSPYLTALMYRQCAGRAGRRGYDLKGKVVFYGLPLDRARRLILSKLPNLGGTFPLTTTMALRMFNLLSGSENAEVAVRAIKSIMSLPQITVNSKLGHEQLMHHLRFSIEYLRRSELIDSTGQPINLFAIAAHLYYTEPGNLALVTLIRSGVIHDFCEKAASMDEAKVGFVIIMANLFGRRYLSKVFTKAENIRELRAKYPSKIVLPPLPEEARRVLADHEGHILRIFEGYAFAYANAAAEIIGPDDALALSRTRFCGKGDEEQSAFHLHLQNHAIPTVVRSSFVGNSGHGDVFTSVIDLTRTARDGLNMNGYAIPSMAQFMAPTEGDNILEHQLNAHLLDFYLHGQVSTLGRANCIRQGDIWYLLQDFNMTLLSVRSAFQHLLLGASEEQYGSQEDLGGAASGADPAEHDPEGEQSEPESPNQEFRSGRPQGVAGVDWKVYLVVSQICAEFEEKFKVIWA